MLPNKRKCLKKNYFSILAFLGLFLAKKQPKLNKNEENWQNPNCLIKFSKIWYVDAFQQDKMLQKNCFSILAFFEKKTALIFWPKTQFKTIHKNFF